MLPKQRMCLGRMGLAIVLSKFMEAWLPKAAIMCWWRGYGSTDRITVCVSTLVCAGEV